MFAKEMSYAVPGAILAVLLAFCLTGTGCSASTAASKAQEGSAESSKSEALSGKEANAAPDKNGFDEKTNVAVNVAGVNFQIPTYYGEQNGKGVYFAETGTEVCMLQLNEAAGSGWSDEAFEKGKAEYINSFIEGMGKDAVGEGSVQIEDATVAGCPAAIGDYKFKMSGKDITMRIVVFYNDEAKKIGTLSLGQSAGTKYDYFNDFSKIISTAEKGKGKSSGPTLGSTITFEGLTIQFGNEIQTTTLENQFSDHNGDTVLAVPVTITNNSSKSTHLNMYAVKAFGSKGVELDQVFTYFDDDARMAGDMRPGASQEAKLYFLYDGNGTYYLDFGIYKTAEEVEVPVNL